MSERGVVAYGWYAPVEKPGQVHESGNRYTIPYVLLYFFTDVMPDMLEISDESKLMVPWRTTDADISNLHPEHQKLFWEGGVVEAFRGKDFVVPRHHTLLVRGQSFLLKEQKVAAVWCDSVEEAEKILKRILA